MKLSKKSKWMTYQKVLLDYLKKSKWQFECAQMSLLLLVQLNASKPTNLKYFSFLYKSTGF